MASLPMLMVWITMFMVQIQAQERVLYLTQENQDQSFSILRLMFGHPNDWFTTNKTLDEVIYPLNWGLGFLRPGRIVADYNTPGDVFIHDRDNSFIYQVAVSRLTSPKIDNPYKKASSKMKDMTLDWVSKNIYYTDRQMVALWSYKSKRAQVVLDKLDSPDGIDVDPQRGLLFWTEPSAGKIRSSTVVGENGHDVHSGLDDPTIVTVDIPNAKLFWISSRSTKLETSDYDGENRQTLLTNIIHQISTIDVIDSSILLQHQDGVNTFVYFNNGSYHGHVYINTTQDFIQEGLWISSPETQPAIASACSTNNGDCDHICVHDPAGQKCLCEFGYTLHQTDGKTCLIGVAAKDVLFVVDRAFSTIYQIDLQTEEVHQIPIKDAKELHTLTFDPLTNTLYWIDKQIFGYRIRSVNLDTKNETTVKNLPIPSYSHSMALAPTENILYYHNGGLKQLMALDLNTKRERVLIRLATGQTAIGTTLDVANGYIYWIRSGLFSTSIERYDLTKGSNEQLLGSTDVEEAFDLALDKPGGMLYWSDYDKKTVERRSLAGGSTEVVMSNVRCAEVEVDATSVYCSSGHGVIRINKQSFRTDNLGPPFYGFTRGLEVYAPDYQPVEKRKTTTEKPKSTSKAPVEKPKTPNKGTKHTASALTVLMALFLLAAKG